MGDAFKQIRNKLGNRSDIFKFVFSGNVIWRAACVILSVHNYCFTLLITRLATSETYGYTGKGGSECVTKIFTKRGSGVVNALVAANLAVTSYTQVEFNDNEVTFLLS